MKIIFCGGGTLGHIFPALSIIKHIKSKNKQIEYAWISRKNDKEIEIIESDDIKCYPITCGKLRRYFSVQNFLDFFKVFIGFFQALRILKKEKPDLLFSKGGYVSVPVVYAAKYLKIKVITHESDMTLGLATRLNSKVAIKTLKGYPLNEIEEKDSQFVYSGNPLREDLLYFKDLDVKEYEQKINNNFTDRYSQNVKNIIELMEKKFDPKKKIILVLGGSLGAMEINNLVSNNLDLLCEKYNVYHQMGEKGYRNLDKNNYISTKFINNELGYLYKKADLIISRCGANALNEEISFRLNILAIPLKSNATRGEQVKNSEYYQNFNLLDIYEKSMNFIDTIENSIDNNNIEKRQIAYNSYFSKEFCDNANEIIYNIIKETLEEGE